MESKNPISRLIVSRKGSVAGKGAAVFTVVILSVIVDQLLNGTTFTSSLATTIKPYVVPAMILATIVVAISMARRK